ncbi:GAF domain-containing sensor histidine kinase [Leptothoe spongobia]|uniref:histidine kinase n=1 Tax=Leptothoe spongobia TAU-MAC 1115 TaxID=1967444 RepID=A0A947DGP7_9CYAN|nr:GAF domain-containing sensor histidine kinase [Leptothoe spongobia]MBT9316339.1 GAF domain-containing protein [Leptothoe spongobia TAU-MAC 1115]
MQPEPTPAPETVDPTVDPATDKQKVHLSRLAQTTLDYLMSLSFRQGNLQQYLNDIARGVSELTAMDWSVVTLNRGDYNKILASNIDLGEGSDEAYPIHGSVAKTVVQTQRPLTVTDSQCETQYGETPEGYRAYLGVPLQSPAGKLLGTICCFNKQPRNFDPEEVKCVELFAERATTAIDNFQMYQQQLKFNERLEAEVAKRTAELKEAQTQLIEKERLAAIGEFTSMIVHEIRNPLTTVRMGLHALKALDLSERDRNRLSLALEEESRLKQLLDGILQYAKPQVLETTQCDLNQLIKETVETLSEQPDIAERSLNVKLAASAVYVACDRDKLKQVLINLISNACEAIDKGEQVTISLSQTEQAYLTVHNGGTPIPPDTLARLTQPFFSTKSSGNGLGLAIVKRIIDAHQGSLTFTSTPETGTTATVYLPAD